MGLRRSSLWHQLKGEVAAWARPWQALAGPARLTARVNPTIYDPTTHPMRSIAPCIVGLTLAVNLERDRSIFGTLGWALANVEHLTSHV